MKGSGTTAQLFRRLAGIAAALSLGAAGACSDSLVDHSAPADVLNPSGCGPGEVLCGSLCQVEDANHCGASCSACPAPSDPNAGPVCTEAHACAFECDAGFLRVGGGCERAVAVSGGFAHTCAVTTSGKVKCWGANEHGQLGDGSGADSAYPVDVSLPAGASAIAAGYVHTCAVVGASRDVWCWGDNTTGALGDGTTTGHVSPVQIVGLSGASALSAGGGENGGTPPAPSTYYGHTCALVGGSISCWGSNDSGQLGDNSFAQSTTPVPVALGNLSGQATAISNGDRHTCAIVAGGVWCWGAAGSWQLGNGSQSDQSKPVQAQGLQTGASMVAAGASHTCAVVSTALQCWGSNSQGQAADGNNSTAAVQRPTAVAPAGIATPSAAAGGGEHTCALDGATGAVTCFGANDASQLSGNPTTRGERQVLSLPSAAIGVVAGQRHSCALLQDRGIVCWGANGRGQLGRGIVSAAEGAPAEVSGR